MFSKLQRFCLDEKFNSLNFFPNVLDLIVLYFFEILYNLNEY